MTPIISPWVFYLMEVATKLNFFILACVFIFLAIAGYHWLNKSRVEETYYSDFDFYYDHHGHKLTEEEYKMNKTRVLDAKKQAAINRIGIFKRFLLAGIVSLILFTLIPTDKTITYMVVAQNVTYENIDKAKISADKLVDYIINKVDKLNQKEVKSK